MFKIICPVKAIANIFGPPGDAHCRVDALSLVHPARRTSSVQMDAVQHLASTALIYSASSLMTDAFDLSTLSSYPVPVSASNAFEHIVSVRVIYHIRAVLISTEGALRIPMT